MFLFYFNVAFLVLLVIISRNYRIDRAILILLMAYFAFLTMFRAVTVGNDTVTYATIFDQIANTSNLKQFTNYIKNSSTEVGFIVFCKLLSFISDDRQILFIVSGAFCYYVLGKFLLKYSKSTVLAVYLAYTIVLFDFYASGVRQALSMSLILLAYIYMDNKKKLKSIVLLAIAVLFHYSSIIVIPIYFLLKIKDIDRFKKYVFIISAAVFIAFEPLLSMVLRFLPKYAYYIDSVLFVREFKTAVFLKAVVFALIFIVGKYTAKDRDEIKNLDGNDELFEKITFLIPFVFLISFNARALARFAVYLIPFAYIYYPNEIEKMTRNNKRIAIVLSLICFFAYAVVCQELKTPEWQSTYPYTFFWEQW